MQGCTLAATPAAAAAQARRVPGRGGGGGSVGVGAAASSTFAESWHLMHHMSGTGPGAGKGLLAGLRQRKYSAELPLATAARPVRYILGLCCMARSLRPSLRKSISKVRGVRGRATAAMAACSAAWRPPPSAQPQRSVTQRSDSPRQCRCRMRRCCCCRRCCCRCRRHPLPPAAAAPPDARALAPLLPQPATGAAAPTPGRHRRFQPARGPLGADWAEAPAPRHAASPPCCPGTLVLRPPGPTQQRCRPLGLWCSP